MLCSPVGRFTTDPKCQSEFHFRGVAFAILWESCSLLPFSPFLQPPTHTHTRASILFFGKFKVASSFWQIFRLDVGDRKKWFRIVAGSSRRGNTIKIYYRGTVRFYGVDRERFRRKRIRFPREQCLLNYPRHQSRLMFRPSDAIRLPRCYVTRSFA